MNVTMRPGKTVAAGVAIAAVAGVAILASIFMRGGGTGSGAGSGTGPAEGAGSAEPRPAASLQTTQPAPEVMTAGTTRPMKVIVRESSYFVDGRQVDLAQLVDLAEKVPDGPGVPILIEREPTARAKAEEDLKAALNQRSIVFGTD